MDGPKLKYFPEEDIIHVFVSDGKEVNSVEISRNITAELNADGDIIGVEILSASSYIRDNILNTVQAKLLINT